MSSLVIPIIIDKKNRRLPKPFNNRPGYDMKYVELYINKYCGINDYQRFFDELFETERRYDTLSVIRPNETPQQWAIRVRVPLQELVSKKKRSVYHAHALFLAFGKVNDEKPKKIYASAIYRYIERLEPANLMKQHWDYSCSKAKTRDANDNTPDDMKFLGLTRHEVKNSQTREQFNQWRTKWIEFYKNNPMMRSSIINRQYKEYYILDNWINSKKSQLRVRFQKRLLEIEA
ncbi:hypothetical protein C2G38_2211657 [Gigaspora rosea]|uniref:Uncharacterized protein n=1 Tax=Gigaspora rosea TaxID=44941 RepID=A0A397UH76_9GLOM|nr:hypothetical protein C2G38_2211657 [Gigaspora rosea]